MKLFLVAAATLIELALLFSGNVAIAYIFAGAVCTGLILGTLAQ